MKRRIKNIVTKVHMHMENEDEGVVQTFPCHVMFGIAAEYLTDLMKVNAIMYPSGEKRFVSAILFPGEEDDAYLSTESYAPYLVDDKDSLAARMLEMNPTILLCHHSKAKLLAGITMNAAVIIGSGEKLCTARKTLYVTSVFQFSNTGVIDTYSYADCLEHGLRKIKISLYVAAEIPTENNDSSVILAEDEEIEDFMNRIAEECNSEDGGGVTAVIPVPYPDMLHAAKALAYLAKIGVSITPEPSDNIEMLEKWEAAGAKLLTQFMTLTKLVEEVRKDLAGKMRIMSLDPRSNDPRRISDATGMTLIVHTENGSETYPGTGMGSIRCVKIGDLYAQLSSPPPKTDRDLLVVIGNGVNVTEVQIIATLSKMVAQLQSTGEEEANEEIEKNTGVGTGAAVDDRSERMRDEMVTRAKNAVKFFKKNGRIPRKTDPGKYGVAGSWLERYRRVINGDLVGRIYSEASEILDEGMPNWQSKNRRGRPIKQSD